jgi:hypothetical protein
MSAHPDSDAPDVAALASDDTIPMLTEVVSAADDIPELTDRLDGAGHASGTDRVPGDLGIVGDPADAADPLDLTDLATQVRNAVTQRLLERSREQLDAHLRQHLATMLAAEVDALVAERLDDITARLRAGLEPVVRELVAQAVSQELARYNRGLSSPPSGP